MITTTPDTPDRFDALEQFVHSGSSASVALVRALAAVVREDGVVRLPELSALTDAATQLEASNLCVYTALRSIEQRPGPNSWRATSMRPHWRTPWPLRERRSSKGLKAWRRPPARRKALRPGGMHC
jgi:hypothetical protein